MTLMREPDWGVGAGPEELAAGIATVRPGFGEYLGAQVREGFWATTTGQGIAQAQKRIGGETEAPLTAEEWRQSEWFRASVPFDEAMTPTRARAVAETFDANEYRRWLISQRKAGIVEGTAGFAAGVVGSIPDPVNFIPFFGPAYRAATVARFGAIGGRAMLGAGEAALGTAIAQPFLMTSRQQFGDDVTLADAMLDIALSAFAGAAIGGTAGVWSRMTTRTVTPKGGEPEIRIEPRAPEATARDPIPDAQTQEAAGRAMNMAMRDLAEGRAVDVGALPEIRDALRRIEVAGNQAAIRVENLGGRQTIDFSPGAEPDIAPRAVEPVEASGAARGPAPETRATPDAPAPERPADQSAQAWRETAPEAKAEFAGAIIKAQREAERFRLSEASRDEAAATKAVEARVATIRQAAEKLGLKYDADAPLTDALASPAWREVAAARSPTTARAKAVELIDRAFAARETAPAAPPPARTANPERKALEADTDALLADLEADPRYAETAKAARADLARAAAFDEAAPAAASCLKG